MSISNCKITRNSWYGILIACSRKISVERNLIEANDRSGIMLEYLAEGSENIGVNRNIIRFNNGYGLESDEHGFHNGY